MVLNIRYLPFSEWIMMSLCFYTWIVREFTEGKVKKKNGLMMGDVSQQSDKNVPGPFRT